MRPASNRFRLVMLAVVLASPVGPLSVNAAKSGGCMPVGVWVYPGRSEQPDDVLGALARRGVVLLGESHDEAEHHRWQLHTIAALLSRRPDMVLGFEMFPRRVQAVLNRWSKRELNEADFLREVNWTAIWGNGAEFYLPLFHFARMHRLPMLALNVDRTISQRIAAQGLAAIPNGEREGVGDPAPASSAYRDHLFETFKKHPRGDEGASADSEQFQRFVEAQLFWDRAMAEVIAAARRDRRHPLVVGIMGQGHVEYRYGVAHQLAALGVDDVATALPWHVDADCRMPDAEIADAVFGVAPPSKLVPPPRLGVMVSVADNGVRIEQVIPQSIADATGLQVGDVIEIAAGVSVRRPADLVAVIRRQAPGTWLPLTVRRAEQVYELLARFPTGP
jgi:uncharacterized iron-regulated protein